MVPHLLGEPTARPIPGIADDKPIVAMGAVDLHNQWKGGRLFHGLHKALLKRSDVALVLLGRSSETLDCAKSFGLVTDDRMMPPLLNVADIFVSTATAAETSFISAFNRSFATIGVHGCGLRRQRRASRHRRFLSLTALLLRRKRPRYRAIRHDVAVDRVILI